MHTTDHSRNHYGYALLESTCDPIKTELEYKIFTLVNLRFNNYQKGHSKADLKYMHTTVSHC